jgi:hypothetical protein
VSKHHLLANSRPRFLLTAVVVGTAVITGLGGGIAVAASSPARQAGTATLSADASTDPPAPADLVTITPVRVLDTRVPTGVAAKGPLGPGATINVSIAGSNGIPASATGVAATVTIPADATAASYITVWPTGQTQPLASANNATPGITSASAGIFDLGTGGDLSVYNAAGATNVVIDVTAYLIPAPAVPPALPTITTDAPSYAAGATVTISGAGWSNCTAIKVDVFGLGGATVGTGITPAADGTITVPTFAAPDVAGEYQVFAQGSGDSECQALTTFTVS